MMADNPLHDPEREHLARTGEVLKRVDRCANRKRRGAAVDCPNDASPGWGSPSGGSYCSGECAAESELRSAQRHVGGGLCTNSELDEEQVGGTRFPQENSRDGSGYA